MADDTRRGPVLIELEDAAGPGPAEAPPVPDVAGAAEAPQGRAMQMAATLAARRPSRLARWFWGLLTALIGVVVSTLAWNFVLGLIASNAILGWAVAALIAAFVLVALAIGAGIELEVLGRSALLFPVSMIGTWLGARAFAVAPHAIYRRVATGLLFAIGLAVIVL